MRVPLLILCGLLGGCVMPMRAFDTAPTDGAAAQTLFRRGALTSGLTRDGSMIDLNGVVPAGDLLCGSRLEPPCIAASDLVETTIVRQRRTTAAEWAIQSPLLVLGVALSPLYLLPTPRQPGWLERADNPCIQSGETTLGRGRRAESVAEAGLLTRHADLDGRCLLFISQAAPTKTMSRRLWFMAVARLRFEALACVDDWGEPDTTWRWIVPNEIQMDEAGMATWPDELRAVLNDPATFDYPGLVKACAAHGGARPDPAPAIEYARKGWPFRRRCERFSPESFGFVRLQGRPTPCARADVFLEGRL